MIKKCLLSLLLTATSFAFLAQSVFAQSAPNGISLSVYPSSFDFHAKPGDKISDKFRIRNDLSTPLKLTITVRKLVTDKDSGQPVPVDLTAEDTFGSWVHFDNQTFTALPKEWNDIKFTITVPRDAAFGYYYVFEIKPSEEVKATGTGAVVTGHISIAALLTVENGSTNVSANVMDFKSEHMVNEYLPVTFLAKIHNLGNVHIRPRGNIFIRGLGQSDVAILDVNQIQGAVLPNGTRTFNSDWSEGFLVKTPVLEDGNPKFDSKGKPVTKLTFNWDKLTEFRFGKYTANLLMVYDTGKRDATLEATTTFWIIPYKALFVIIASIILFVVIIRKLLRSYINRELRRRK